MQENSLHRLEDELAKNNRRIDELNKKVDLLYQDREILENIIGRLTGLEEQVKLARQHDDVVRKDIKDEFNIVGDRLIAKIQLKVDQIEDLLKKKQKLKSKPSLIRRILRKT